VSVEKLLLTWAVLFLSCSCSAPVPEGSAHDPSLASVRFEPSAEADAVSNVVHVHLTDATANAASVALFEGTISSYYLGKFKHGDVPNTLASRQIPAVSWRANAELILAPLQPLALGTYSVISPEGLIAEFKVGVVQPVLERLWPPAANPGSAQFAVYCRPESSVTDLPSGESLLFEPSGDAVELAAGVDASGLFSERCSHFESVHTFGVGEIWVPPPSVGQWALSPAVFAAPEQAEVELSCRDDEIAFGPGCASVADDRLTVRTATAPLLWIVHTARGALVEVSAAGKPLSIEGLLPASNQRLWGSARDLSGVSREFDVEVRTAAARERPILNEALADALGPEPQSEWIELLNDGSLAVDLAEYSLQDGGGRTPLPHAVVGPREYALLVREDFAPNGIDVAPAPGAHLIRVPTLGKGGLSNAGERLSLVNGAGIECSVLPALAGKAGQSLARRTPASADDDAKAFSFGTPTPGVANGAAP